ELVIHDRKSQKPVFSIDAAYFGISLSRSILYRQLVLGQFLIDGAKITVKYADNHWYVSGLSEEAIVDDGLRAVAIEVHGREKRTRLRVGGVEAAAGLGVGIWIPAKRR
ncbi:MAG: hypothetical protein ACPG77_19070, partial [Nannocystaceae bacterium]